jgi:hypothetical protein
MRKLFIAAALSAVMLVPASPSLASTYNPTGEFAQFGE